MKQELIERFKQAFDGYHLAYGLLGELEEDETGKMQGSNIVIKKEITNELFEKHLSGTGNGLRLIPLKYNDKLKYAVIDLDRKQKTNPLKHTIEELEDKIKKLGLPLIPCKSKSGDVHLYCFMKEEIDAKILMNRISEWAGLLGYGAAEKFPKQVKRVSQEDVGSALNLPYYNANNTSRYAVNKHKKLNLEEFLDYVETAKCSIEEIKNFKHENIDDSFDDAPPCLQTIASLEVCDGSRNIGLYNFAVYFKQKYADDFEARVQKINADIFQPMLSIKEVENIIKSVNKKEYFYTCSQDPIISYCNKTECYKRDFGIGCQTSAGELFIDSLTKRINKDQITWYAEIQGERVQLTTEELLNQKLLQKRLLDSLNKIYAPMKQQKWIGMIDKLIKNCTFIVDPEDASREGQFKALLKSYLSGASLGDKPEHLKQDRPYFDKNNNVIWFKSTWLFIFLNSKRFFHTNAEIWGWLKEMGGTSSTIRINKNTTEHAWKVPAPEFYDPNLESKDDEIL